VRAVSNDLKAAAFEMGAEPALVLGADGGLLAVNEAAEALFAQSLSILARGRLADSLPAVADLVARAEREGGQVREHGLHVAPPGQPGFEADETAVLVTLRPRGAFGGERSPSGGLRSMVELGRTLAHEIRNPLAGIRGAAQLLKTGASVQDAPLAQLIVDETDRIRRLVDRLTVFADDAPPRGRALNIHQVLDRVRAVAANGAADGLVLREAYDPSLPDVWGDEDQLIQVFLNLVKNAAEAAASRGDGDGRILISTAYRHGVRVRGPGAQTHGAPLEVRIQDNGPGVPEAVRAHLFQPFVSTKPQGMGLGLPLVAKLVAAHGGLIDFDSEPGRTSFRVLLPAAPRPTTPRQDVP
jgi:two-component system, NtrC family, nitrogen regulation sensor histidine kinase GlnL